MKGNLSRKNIPPKALWHKVIVAVTMIVIGSIVVIATFFIIEGKRLTRQSVSSTTVTYNIVDEPSTQFPVGVNPKDKEIVENPVVSLYFEEHISSRDGAGNHTGWLRQAMGKLALMNWYQNLASLSSRILVIQSGERKEQVADNFAKILKWDANQKANFLLYVEQSEPELKEGKFSPGTYTVSKGATPEDVAPLILDKFSTQVLSRYGDDIERVVPLKDALVVASLLEREAYDFEDMRHISGVIWNRLFIDMRLQLDASLQYAKGSKPTEAWWPKVRPQDKYIASEYNTYKHAGLPPTPIANPSLEAILAALNPSMTECMYYFHDKNAGFHCTETYEEHVALLKEYYGRGR